jgi:hypothetical protein
VISLVAVALIALVGCDRRPPVPSAPIEASVVPAPIMTPPALCVTEGRSTPAGARASIREPATRGYLAGSTGDAARLSFTYRGRSQSSAALASGATRAQLGLKLRAQDSCNVIYVMWRIEPISEIVVQIKRNDARAHRECGNAGYRRVRPAVRASPPSIDDQPHELRAAIVDDRLDVFADQALVWRGSLPVEARTLRGPTGFRTDNVDVDLELDAPSSAGAQPSCGYSGDRSKL